MNASEIKTDYLRKPGPLRNFDWSAWWEEDEESEGRIGFGATREQAIGDLVVNFPRRCEGGRAA